MKRNGEQEGASAGNDAGRGSLLKRANTALAEALDTPLAPGLYLVATPIGNLADISLRALGVLARADVVYAEDTRHTRKLTSHFGLDCKLEPYHEHSAERVRSRILARIRGGEAVALVSDAGTPLISDPGYKLVRAALEEGLAVTSIPGPSAGLAALTSSGLPSDAFLFAGFLPPKREARRKRLEELAGVPATLVFYEAPSRLSAMLADAAHVLGAREAAVAKELTKLHEAVARGPLEQLVEKVEGEFSAKGEFVVLIGPPAETGASEAEIERALAEALKGASVRDAAREVAQALGVNRNRAYKLALALKESGGS